MRDVLELGDVGVCLDQIGLFLELLGEFAEFLAFSDNYLGDFWEGIVMFFEGSFWVREIDVVH